MIELTTVYLNPADSILTEPHIPEKYLIRGELGPEEISLIKKSVIEAKKRVLEKVRRKLGEIKISDIQVTFSAKMSSDSSFNQKVSERYALQLAYELNKVAEKVEKLRPEINWRKKNGEILPTWLGINQVTQREVSVWTEWRFALNCADCTPDSGEKAYAKALRAELMEDSKIVLKEGFVG
ncbi:putative uncharacterized protein [Parachlamydia acanthamoebae UV-7]|jgi:hypothetical protein|uniref:Uncharacterized protein n=1 Tax=Parachlamydia acanthamoebae (strain UV7) TaxID=765952 RepID=F8KZ60_PARAV|nr:hypothetical protein [Parachlamydia acanthamoebae]EFB41937.1 hypothetical protein pah_c022o266 [Parachlamydia acanthamoebae str. Hall's coccus]CCB86183.1 putative uncharacterized protein [Parachlamydia acanthamoebae UV-7]